MAEVESLLKEKKTLWAKLAARLYENVMHRNEITLTQFVYSIVVNSHRVMLLRACRNLRNGNMLMFAK